MSEEQRISFGEFLHYGRHQRRHAQGCEPKVGYRLEEKRDWNPDNESR
jgi:hypothetical protein